MPEGDTIHYAANRMRPVLEGLVPRQIITPQSRHLLDDWPRRLAGRAVSSVHAHGKHLFLRFEGGLTLRSHLRMSGAWALYSAGQRWRRPASSAWLVIRHGGHEVVQFNGPVLELMRDSRERFDQRLAALGQDILGVSFDERRFLRALGEGEQDRTVGQALLDQRTLAGIGNLWKAEACHGAGVDPRRAVSHAGERELLAIVGFAREHMARSAREGMRERPRAVYGRQGMPCRRCGERIRAAREGEENRITFWCPGCQH
ncbi:MAG TPA: DNA-formamidopyrimidine glycosylase family protein [Solirubrobacteraceae bacterium]|jgi:endonuclease-8